MVNELPVEKLRKSCDTCQIHCKSTEEIPPLNEIIGQARAVKALRFGLEIKEEGFNIYAAGPSGTGRTTAVMSFLNEVAKAKPVPPDWCYVNNFGNSYQPKAIKLPPGKGKTLQEDVKNFIKEARSAIPKAFESAEYTSKKEATVKVLEKERNRIFSELNEKARQEGLGLRNSPMGMLMISIVNGRPLSDEEIMMLPPEAKSEFQSKRQKIGDELKDAMKQLKDLETNLREELKKLDREIVLYTISYLVTELTEKYKISEVTDYLKDVQNDMADNLDIFLGDQQAQMAPFVMPLVKEVPFKKYDVNVLVDNSQLQGAPVIMELNPTYNNVLGKIEKEAQFGTLTTDFSLIHEGSLHKANGGYLVLPVEELFRNLFTWDALKRSIRNKRINIEEASERLGFIATKSLMPEAIPLDVKVILIGNPLDYHILHAYDPDFREMFKVKADFDTRMSRTEENIQIFANFICTLREKENPKHFDASGIAKLTEHSSRLAGDQEKLSTSFSEIADIIREANFYATKDNSTYIDAAYVNKAIDEKVYRSSMIEEKIREMIERGIILIDTSGEALGQVNGLAVISLGDFYFGRPSRVTVSIGLGKEGLIDIEREAKLGGSIHTKGVLILSGYLTEKYARDKPLSLSARLVFEQSYEGVEGDSASSTELYAILSSLANLPIKQSLAVTGSVNQKGEVQAIGGVNEKIEGFFEVCKAKGLTGEQGVIIPESNVQNLMLKEEVINAAKEGNFHIYPVKTIDEGIEILTGVRAGVRQTDGTFEKDTVKDRVDRRLKEMAEKLTEFTEPLSAEEKNKKE
ncbi:MAG: ATP-binding protein [Candidatus Bathyarchaeota archaeon]